MASAAEQLAANMNAGAFAKATDLHKRLWFTVIALLVYRLGTHLPIPGINLEAFQRAGELIDRHRHETRQHEAEGHLT